MTKTKCCKRKRVQIKLNTLTVNKMVQEILHRLYGTAPYGRCYGFDDTALSSLQEAAESFLEKMWEQLREFSQNQTVTIQHIHLWKQKTDFKLRFKKNNLSLCKIFKH